MRKGGITTIVLGVVGSIITLASVVYGATSSSYSKQIDSITIRQNKLDDAVLQLTQIEAQNATLIKVYGEQIKSLQAKQK